MKKYILGLVAAVTLFSCNREESFLDTEPQGTVGADQISDLIANYPEKAVLLLGGAEAGNNNYLIQFSTNGAGAHDDFGYMSVKTGLDHMTNDLVMYSSHWFNSYYMYVARNVENSRDRMVWNFYYKVVYNMNEIVKLMPAETTGDSSHLKGRAMAMRGLAYLDLVRLYAVGEQGIPYYSKGAGEEINVPARMATTEVYANIEKDLVEAYNLLAGYTRDSKESVNQQVVAGFLARFYMTTKDYAKSAQYAKLARTGYSPMNATQLADGFQFISNPEWMWGSDITGSTTTSYASFFSHMSNRNAGYAGLLGVYRLVDNRLYAKISATDLRKNWFNDPTGDFPPTFNVKFYDNTFMQGDYIYMRAAEFYLVEAEALARSGNEAGAKQVLFDLISKRDPAYTLSIKTGAALLEEIRTHKKIEMWGEGLEFFDMKRNNEALVRNYTGTNHASFGRLDIPAGDARFNFMIPQAELDANPEVKNP